MSLHWHGCSVVRGFRLVYNIINIKFYPRRSEHVVHEIVLSVSPVSRQLLQLESDHFVVCVQHRIHVSVQSLKRINSLQIKLDFNLVIRVCSYNKVNIIPIREQQLFHSIHNVFKSGFRNVWKRFLWSCRFKVAVKHLCLFDPFCTQAFVLAWFIWVIQAQKCINELFTLIVLEWILIFQLFFILIWVKWCIMQACFNKFVVNSLLTS